MIANLPRFMKRNRTAPIHFSPRDAHGTTSGTPTCTRAAGDVGPYHAPRHIRTRTPRPHTHATSAHARHARTWSGATSPARRTHGTPTGTRAAGDVGPYHAPRHVRTRTSRAAHARHAHLVGRDVLGAPRPRNDIGDAHGDAGRRGRRPLPRTAPCPHTHGACLPCQRIETLMGFRNAAAKSRTRACHAFASFTAPAPLQVAPAQ